MTLNCGFLPARADIDLGAGGFHLVTHGLQAGMLLAGSGAQVDIATVEHARQ
jgi:hypothetical protein